MLKNVQMHCPLSSSSPPDVGNEDEEHDGNDDTEDMYFRLGSYFTQLGKVTGIDSSYSDIRQTPTG